jgi:hypothetical protein
MACNYWHILPLQFFEMTGVALIMVWHLHPNIKLLGKNWLLRWGEAPDEPDRSSWHDWGKTRGDARPTDD